MLDITSRFVRSPVRDMLDAGLFHATFSMSASIRLLVCADPVLWTSSASSVFDASRFVYSTFCVKACQDSSIRRALDVLDDRVETDKSKSGALHEPRKT